MQAGSQTKANSLPVALATDQFATPSVTTELLATVTASSSVVLPANANRKGGWVRNVSDTEIFVSLSGTASADKPSVISPGASLPLAGPGWLYTGQVSAILASTGNKPLEVVEL